MPYGRAAAWLPGKLATEQSIMYYLQLVDCPRTGWRIDRSAERLPLGTAILSNIALSLLMWNIALRVAGLLPAA